MNQNTVAVNDDDEIVFKIKRSVIAEALRSDFEMPIPVTDANIDVVVNQIAFQIEEFPTGVPTEFFDLGIDHHKGLGVHQRSRAGLPCRRRLCGKRPRARIRTELPRGRRVRFE